MVTATTTRTTTKDDDKSSRVEKRKDVERRRVEQDDDEDDDDKCKYIITYKYSKVKGADGCGAERGRCASRVAKRRLGSLGFPRPRLLGLCPSHTSQVKSSHKSGRGRDARQDKTRQNKKRRENTTYKFPRGRSEATPRNRGDISFPRGRAVPSPRNLC